MSGKRVLVARCENYREDVDQACHGEIRFRWGMGQSDPCDVCGGRCGVAVAAWERVEPAVVSSERETELERERLVQQKVLEQYERKIGMLQAHATELGRTLDRTAVALSESQRALREATKTTDAVDAVVEAWRALAPGVRQQYRAELGMALDALAERWPQ